ncbi:MAG: 30S ribosomal protein S7 [Candidatus Micrarchaeota archaeon]|nr:30S ribosomal protein S7 [Candidatus Micrarchaeota archaeon]
MFKVFDKWEIDKIDINDASLKQVISLKPSLIPHTFGKYSSSRFAKTKVNIVERLINKLMRGGTGEKVSGKIIRTGGRLQGKKIKLMKIVEDSFDLIYKKTKENPVQVLVKAVENAAPREEVTRVAAGGVSYQLSVDVSATRRLDVALRNLTLSALMRAFDSKNSLSTTLADEIINTAKGDLQTSYSVKKKDEMERMAKAAR